MAIIMMVVDSQFTNEFHFSFKGTAIRIEDNVVITEDGCEILNKKCPETVDEICTLMQN